MAKTAAAPKAAPKAPAADAPKKPNALQAPHNVSPDLAAVIGKGPLSRGEATSKIWDYIKKNNLQDPANKREIKADDKLKKIFGADKVTMFEMTKLVSKHLTKA